MALLDSLPARPLTPAELAALNRADSVEMAVSVDDPADGDEGRAADPTDALLLVTDDWVKALAFEAEEGGWRVLKTVSLDAVERFDALQSCEEAIRFHRSNAGGSADATDADAT